MNQSEDHTTAVGEVHPDDLAASAGDDAILGTTLHETYKVVRFLAEGGMGRVYEAHHTRISTKRFAIKFLLAELKHSLEVRMRFRREAEAAASIDHPNVVGVHDFGYAPDGRPYLVCDLLEGRELGTMLEGGKPLDTSMAISITRQLCRALEAAHDKGVIHRDLKPGNVFLVGDEAEPEVRVLDFGLSRVVELTEASVTQTGIVMGTPSYMSPEQARGERADHRVDVYGAGAVLYACLTGKPPFDEESPHKTVLAVMSSDPMRPRALVASIPPDLEFIVQKAMARDLDERYATMRELEQALTRFEESRAIRTLPERALDPSPPSARSMLQSIDMVEATGVRRRAVAWFILCGVVLIVGAMSGALGVYAIVSPNRPLQTTELLLATLAVLGSVFTPGVLLLRWFRRRYWNNSARMVNLVAALRGPLVAGLAVYGVAALIARGLDAARPHLADSAPAPNASGWIGWAPFLFGLALLAAIGGLVRHRILTHGNSLSRRIFAGPVVVALVIAGAAPLIATGYGMSRGAARDVSPFGAGAEATPGPAPAAPTGSAVSTPTTARPVVTSPTSSQTTPPPVETSVPAVGERASDDELKAAIDGGAPALSALRTRYPKDPRVLEPLAIELGKNPERSSELLRVLDALFTEAPDKANDAKLAAMVQAAALSPATSQRAIELMRGRMGARGADMLFELVLKQPDLRAKARAALESPEVQRTLTPALKIAYDLYIGSSCAARAQLLAQAARDGDERAIAILAPLAQKTKRGCGAKKAKPCPAACAAEAPAIEQTIAIIEKRLAAAAGNP